MNSMNNYLLIRFSLIGLLIGLIFPACAWMIGISASGLPLDLASLSAIHNANFIHYFVDTTPLILGAAFYFLGRAYSTALQDSSPFTNEIKIRSKLTKDELIQLMEIVNAPIFGIDTAGCFNEWNQTAAKITGFTKMEVVGKDVVGEFISDEYKTLIRDVLDNAMGGQETLNFELPFYRKNGERLDLLMSATPRRDAEGNIFGVIGVGQDITEANKAQAESRRTAVELTQFVNTANAPIFGIDSQGLVNEWNQTAAEITGYTKMEVLGKDLVAEFITDDYKAPVREVLENALNGEETANYEFPLYTKSGQRVDVLLNATARHNVEGRTIGVIGVGQDITEANKAQAESRRTAVELTQLVDTANAPIFGIDSQGLVNEWNQTAAEITGYTKMEVLGKDLVAEFITDDYKAPVREVLENALNGEETANYEFPLYTKSGQRVDVLLNATTRRNVEGRTIGVIGVGQDITEANKAQAESRRTAAELTQLVDTANAPIFGIDSLGLVNEWNQTAAKITGYTKMEVLGKDLVAEFITDDYKAPVREVLENALNGEETANYEFPLYTKSGQRVDVLLNATTRRNVEGRTIGVIGVGQDITEANKAQAESRRTADELTQFVDTANAPIFGIDSQGLVNEWNQTAAEITGYTTMEVLGKDLVAEFITDDYKAPVREVLENALNGEETANYEFPLYTKSGQRVDVLLNATTRRNVEGRTIGVIGVGQDITELRQKQIALNQAQKMETVGQLTGGIAHDFNNLLSVIGGNLRFLKQDIGSVSNDIEELFEDAMSATKDGADLTARLLAFSRNRTLKPELKEVNETIDNFTRFLSRTLGKSIDLSTDLSKSPLYINVDTSQLENALLNLAINARDAMPDGGRITIKSEALHYDKILKKIAGSGQDDFSLDPGDYVVVTVSDTGSGISKKDLAHVYEPFFTTKDVGKGSGLGLSMIYGFIQQSNGQCHIRSRVGEGTKFSMYFPQLNRSLGSESPSQESEDVLKGSELVLVVEDEPRVRRVTLRDLNKLGYRTLEAENAFVAKKIISSGEKIDLVFSDVLMPGKVDGKMLGLWIEKNYPDIKIILTSGYSKSRSDSEENESHLPLIRKPYTIEKLAHSIRNTLR